MKTLKLPPYTDNLENRLPFTGNRFCDRQSGRWLLFDNGQKVIVVDSFCGIIRELNYSKGFCAVLKACRYHRFVPDDQKQAWILTHENPDDGASLIKLFQLTFDYEKNIVVAQKKRVLLAPEDMHQFHPISYTFKVFFDNDFITIKAHNLQARKRVILIYKWDNILCKTTPDFTYEGPDALYNLCRYMIGSRLYFFERDIMRRVRLRSVISKLSKLHYYDFENKSRGTIELEGAADCIHIKEVVFDRRESVKTFVQEWHKQRLFVISSIQLRGGNFMNALIMLDLEHREWKSIKLNKQQCFTSNPLFMNASDGVLIFTNTHVRNPMRVLSEIDPNTVFINCAAFENNSQSHIYRMAIGCPEKLVNLAYLCAQKVRKQWLLHYGAICKGLSSL